jgi:uncharacterized protein involved in exopolysaccharide biosynthesis
MTTRAVQAARRTELEWLGEKGRSTSPGGSVREANVVSHRGCVLVTVAPVETINLRELGSRLAAGRWWILASAVLFAAIAAAVAFLTTPTYRATTVLVAASTDKGGLGSLGSALGQLGGLASLAGVNVGAADAQTQEALAVIQSREFTEAFIQDEQLMPKLYAARWDERARAWKGDRAEWPTLAQAFKRFDEHVRSVSRDKTTGLITLNIRWRDPVEAARWANTLVARLNAEMRSRAIARTSASLGYLEKELAVTSAVETRQAVSRLIEAQINQRMLANVTQEYAFRVVDRALPPDPLDIVWPQKALLLIAGPVFGVIFGALGILAFAMLTDPR